MPKVIKSKPQVLESIGQSSQFQEYWEALQNAMCSILNEAHTKDGNMNKWIDVCKDAKDRIDDVCSIGWGVRHGDIVE